MKKWKKAMSKSIRHIEEWGAKSSEKQNPEFEVKNTEAINEAFAELAGQGGVELRFGPGRYWTNAQVGIDGLGYVSSNITIRGNAFYPTSIHSINYDEPCMHFHGVGGIVMEDLTLIGGRQNLSLDGTLYTRIFRMLFSGGKSGNRHTEWGIQTRGGSNIEFNHCYFYHTHARGTDAAMIMSPHRLAFNNCLFGEDCGGVVQDNGNVFFNNCMIYGSKYLGNEPYVWTDLPNPNVSAFHPDTVPSAFLNLSNGRTNINGMIFQSHVPPSVFINLSNHYQMNINACMFNSPIPSDTFIGFVNVLNNTNDRLGLLVNGNSFHHFESLDPTKEAFILQEPANQPFHNCVVTNNIFASRPGATLLPLETTAPSLIDGNNGNIVNNAYRNNQG